MISACPSLAAHNELGSFIHEVKLASPPFCGSTLFVSIPFDYYKHKCNKDVQNSVEKIINCRCMSRFDTYGTSKNYNFPSFSQSWAKKYYLGLHNHSFQTPKSRIQIYKVGHLLSEFNVGIEVETFDRILLSNVTSKVSESWYQMWIESKI